MKKSKKVFSVLAAVAVITACAAIPASAGTDGWTNLPLSSTRDQRLAARAPVTQSVANHANTSLESSAEVYFNIREKANGHWATSKTYEHARAWENQTIWYAYKCAPGIVLDLYAGAQYPGLDQYTTGTCDFGGRN